MTRIQCFFAAAVCFGLCTIAVPRAHAQGTQTSPPAGQNANLPELAPLPPPEIYSSLHGVARDSSGHPVADAYVTVHNAANVTDRNVVTGPDGSYTAQDLTAGSYEVSIDKLEFNAQKPTSVNLGTADQHVLDLSVSPKPLKGRSLREKLMRNPAHT